VAVKVAWARIATRSSLREKHRDFSELNAGRQRQRCRAVAKIVEPHVRQVQGLKMACSVCSTFRGRSAPTLSRHTFVPSRFDYVVNTSPPSNPALADVRRRSGWTLSVGASL
jgi:hypothetical protein